MASQRSSSATLQSDIKDSAFTNSSPSWAHKEWLQYYNYPSLSQPSAPGHGMGESHITTLSSPTLGLKRQHTALENTSREPHSENAHSYGSDTRQSHTYTPPSPARHPWQRSAGEDTTTTPSLATIHSLIGSSGQASPAPSILSSLGNEGSVYYNPTAGVSSPIGASFLIPQQVALPGGSSLRNSRQQYRGSTNRPSSCSEDECCVTPSSPTVRYHVDSATLFGDGQGGDVGLPPLPPTKRAKPEALAEPRTPPRFRNSVRRNLGEIPYTPYSSITPNYPDSTPGLSPSPGYAATRKNIDFSPNDSFSPRSPQLSPEPWSPLGPAFSRGDITRKTIRKGKPLKAEETLGDAEFWQHVKSDDGTCSADTRDNVSPSLSQRQNAFFPTDSSTPRSSQLSPEPLSPPGPAFWRGDSTHKTSKRLTPIKEETSIDLFSPSSTQRSPQPLSPLGPAFSRDDITRKPIRRRKPVTEEPSTDLLPPRSSQLSPEQFSPRVTAFPRDIPQTTKQRKPPKETLGDAEFWQHIKSDDVSCSLDTSDYGPPPLPPRQRQTESSGRNLNENVPFSRPRTVGHGQTQASLRGLDETVPFSNPGKARRQQPVSNLTSRTYQNFIQQNKMAVIMFYSSASGGPLDPNTLSSHSITAPGGDTPVFASVDCAKEAGLCTGEGVQSYPFYKLYHRGYLLNAVKDFAMLNNGP